MKAPLSLNARQRHVLWATVQQYVATAEPVGSRVLAQAYDLTISPATIRSVMGFLEKSGLLFQPHTSAGRIPSDYGYRLYVDQLVHPSKGFAQQVDNQFSETLDWEGWSMEALLRGAAQILSTLSGYLTLITPPQSNEATIRHLQLVALDESHILLSVVLDSFETQSIVIQLSATAENFHDLEVLERELKILSNFLSTQLTGQALLDIVTLDWGGLDREFQRHSDLLKDAMQTLSKRNQSSGNFQLIMSGLGEVLRQPEFSEVQQVQGIVQLLEGEQAQLWPLVFESASAETAKPQVRVWIGSENPLEPMQSCALVSSSYHTGKRAVGSVSVLGPTRMMYDNAIAVVEAAAGYLSDAFNGGY